MRLAQLIFEKKNIYSIDKNALNEHEQKDLKGMIQKLEAMPEGKTSITANVSMYPKTWIFCLSKDGEISKVKEVFKVK